MNEVKLLQVKVKPFQSQSNPVFWKFCSNQEKILQLLSTNSGNAFKLMLQESLAVTREAETWTAVDWKNAKNWKRL